MNVKISDTILKIETRSAVYLPNMNIHPYSKEAFVNIASYFHCYFLGNYLFLYLTFALDNCTTDQLFPEQIIHSIH